MYKCQKICIENKTFIYLKVILRLHAECVRAVRACAR